MVRDALKSHGLWILLLGLPVAMGVIVFLVWGFGAVSDNRDQLVVYSYSSFISPWGPGPELAERFKEREGVHVKFVDSGDSALIVERLRFQSAQDRVDVVLGIDQLMVPEARSVLKWRPIENIDVTWDEEFPSSFVFKDFIPLDWGPLSFIMRREGGPIPKNLEDLLDPEYREEIVLLDPRTSTPGFQFLYWVLSEKGEEEGFRFLERLEPNIHSVNSSWSTGYNLFKRGAASMAFSYVTSAVFHWVEEDDLRYQPLVFEEGLPFQIEYMAVPEKCVRCDVAEKFVKFLLEPASQHLIMTKNYMLPVVSGVRELEPSFQLLDFSVTDQTLDPGLLGRKRELLERWKKLGL